MSVRSELRAQVEELSGGRCEHPVLGRLVLITRCWRRMQEMAHITPRGMGHKGDRDYLANVMAACAVHARSTDDLSSSEWNAVEQWADCAPDVMAGTSGTRRDALRAFVSELRKSEGWNI